MQRRSGIKHGETDILKKTVEYKKNGNYTTPAVSRETFTYGNTTRTRDYTTDEYGRVTKVVDSVLGTNRYTYDYRGYLTEENTTEYEYDHNGNMTKNGIVSMTYDSTKKDVLVNVGYKYVDYPSNNFLNPNDVDGFEYYYEGRRLIHHNGSTVSVDYFYDNEGLRTKKIVYDTTTNASTTVNYAYEDNKLVCEYTTSKRMDYLYDGNGILYGLIYNGNKYFYLRDHLANILGIIDSSGNLVVSYDYSAYGKLKSITGSMATTLGVDNHMRYKGYYFDEETGFYYCKSRYYVPDWCRWLNADSPAYLKLYSATGNNLFAYCSNDPVNYKQRPTSFGGSAISSSISVGGSSVSVGGSSVGGIQGGIENPTTPWWLSTAVGAIPDFILGVKYLVTHGMHSKFAYPTNTRYMYPIMGGTWRWFGKSSSSFGTVLQGTFKQILTGDARAKFGDIAKSVGGAVGYTAFVNFVFNLYENNGQVDSAMLVDTAIDTAIGVGSYYLAAGAMSLATAGLLSAGVGLPGVVVVGGVVILSIGFEHVIRAISGYWD